MHVAIVVPTISSKGGGVSEVVRLLSAALRERKDLTFEVITSQHLDGVICKEAWSGIQVSQSAVYGPAKYGFSPGLVRALLKSRADIVHVHGIWMFHCLAVLIWSLIRRKPYVVTPHGMLEKWILDRSRGLKYVLSKIYQEKFFGRASATQALTAAEKVDISSYMDPPPACYVIPNFVSVPADTLCKPKWWSADYHGRSVYLFFGRIHEKKGWRELCQAWGDLCDDDCLFRSRSVLVFAGWVDGSTDFETAVAELSNRFENVVFTGPQFGREKQATFQQAAAFILPSKSEGLPMTVLEAWALGVPAILTSECNLPDGFRRGAAIKVGKERRDIYEGLQRFDRLDQTEREKMRASSLSLARNVFSEQAVVGGIIEMFRTVLARSGRVT